ncbi:MAG: type I DNA topoisomerase [Armatimonadetes bacterium]|nr:type I DNA topoisomerase [Armatimonadota bacterium]
MAKSLIIVESAAKTRTIGGFLGPDFRIEASLGHVRDLPDKGLGVDTEHGFKPTYRVMRDKQATVKKLRQAAEDADRIYLATDPDREGEAIAWHLQEALGLSDALRIEFNEITRTAVESALEHPRRVDMDRVNAQQARRVLDRLVGYKLSELLWRKVRNARSAGRVQSVAVRLIVEREREIRDFVPQEYWRITALVCPADRPGDVFEARLERVNGEKVDVGTIADEAAANQVVAELRAARLEVAELRTRAGTRQPFPPFITSTLQRDASTRLGFRPQRTMAAAQRLYEGLPLGGDTPVGMITYMRTDSTRVANEAREECQEYIKHTWSAQHMGAGRRGAAPKRAQDAHECIRPTHVLHHPDEVDRQLPGRDHADERRLYRLIWTRFVASQMAPAKLETTTADIAAGPHLLRASSTKVVFPGYMDLTGIPRPEPKAASENGEEDGEDEDLGRALPPLREGEPLLLRDTTPTQRFTQPPPRYTEASLVKTLEERGIGRPSTYAPILTTITERRYVRLESRRFQPTPLGEAVTEALVQQFPKVLDVDFTATLENELDDVERGDVDWVALLTGFYEPFEQAVAEAMQGMDRVRVAAVPTDHECPKCGAPMLQREGRWGTFLGCSKYPECDGIMRLGRDGKPSLPTPRIETEYKCENCGKPLILRNSRRGPFLGCAGYPKCRTIVKLDDTIRGRLDELGIAIPAPLPPRGKAASDEEEAAE